MNRKPGDWNCRCCQYHNFSRRDVCQKCGEPRSGEYGGVVSLGGGSAGGADVRPGDWYCSSCSYHNFANRANCLKCSAFRDDSATGFDGGDAPRIRGYAFSGGGAVRVPWKTGDWICTMSGCNVHNYASRMECYKCHAPRESGTEV
uniref:Putative RNA-binding protein C17H9.04c n=1 Tax=Anthurium amnicola TaxID=1678845 RepID=A0A1D1ZJC4_9ARAE